jgi:succinate dehydrogenase/fumarate reductase cytochrome b subunit
MIKLSSFSSFSFFSSVFETIGAPFALQAFQGWDTWQNGVMYSGMGVICILALVFLPLFSFCFGLRTLLLASSLLLIAAFGLLIEMTPPYYCDLSRFIASVSLCSLGYASGLALLISLLSSYLDNNLHEV